jgi:hypothetical protein
MEINIHKPLDIPFEGPAVTWNIKETKRMVTELGKKKAIERITGEQFNKEYVKDRVNNIIKTGNIYE